MSTKSGFTPSGDEAADVDGVGDRPGPGLAEVERLDRPAEQPR